MSILTFKGLSATFKASMNVYFVIKLYIIVIIKVASKILSSKLQDTLVQCLEIYFHLLGGTRTADYQNTPLCSEI